MSNNIIKVGVLKVGCLGTLTLLEMLLDERADRTDIDVRVIGTGAKVGPKQCKEATEIMLKIKPKLVVLVGPAQTTQGPIQARKMLKAAGIPTILISDSPLKKVIADIEKAAKRGAEAAKRTAAATKGSKKRLARGTGGLVAKAALPGAKPATGLPSLGETGLGLITPLW